MEHYEYEISLYVEDELPADKKEELLSHLSNCEECRNTLRDFTNVKNSIVKFYNTLPAEKPLVGISHPVINTFSFRFRRARVIIPLSIAASAILMFLLFKPGIHKQIISSPSAGKAGPALVKTNTAEIDLSSNNKPERIIEKRYNKKIHPKYSKINLSFNKVIDNVLEKRKGSYITTGLQNIAKSIDQQEFNSVINSFLYMGYFD